MILQHMTPWTVEEDGEELPILITAIVNGQWTPICSVRREHADLASRIAAAPELLALLKRMEPHLHAQWKAEIRAAIAKAEGK